MNKHLQAILSFLQQSETLKPEEKKLLANAVNESDREITITEFKLERTEKVKRTTAILLEETIAELEQKRKAVEAQNHELEIEASLERVRARAMAMQKSEELKEVIQVVYDQFNHLNILIEHTGFIIDYKENDDMHIWLTDKYASPFEITIPYFDSPHWNSFIEAKEKGKSFFANQLAFDVKNKFYEDLFKLIPSLPEESKQSIFRKPGLAISTVLLENVGLYIENFSGIPYTDEENNTLMRFGNVFQQTYTRFLDLQKAEAQAREAQIEAGLERVRSKTMAMHNSHDVGNTVAGLFDELVVLGLEKSARCGIGILDESNIMELWTASTNDNGEMILAIGHLDMTLHPLLKGVKKTWSGKKQSLTYELQGEDLLNYFNILNDYPDYHIYIDVKTLPEKIIHNSFYFTDGLIYCFTRNPISEDLAKVVKRFSGVFGQTYKRYLDLRKAEAQAREAQIEAALERVRSKTMAMHKSEQLSETAQVLFEQFSVLGKIPDRIAIGIIHEELKVIEWWVTDQLGSQVTRQFNGSILEPTHAKWVAAWKEGKDTLVVDLTGEELKEWIAFVRHEVNMHIDESMMKGRRVHHAAFFSQGLLLISAHEPMPNETMALLLRFARVFNQTYTRFLDLQKAEAQAQEAQIETALERVRSRSMAMHKSDELLEVITVVSKQLQHLKLKFNTVSFANSNQDHDYKFWFAAMGDPNPIYIQVPYLNNPMYDRMKEVLASGTDFYTDTLTPEESRQWHEHMFAHADLSFLSEETKRYILRSGYARSIAITPGILLIVSNYAARPYTDDENDIIRRFAAVFQQSYTRFLDLQKAEAQAREAQIEAALERVRAKALAMQTSKDLLGVANVLREQMDSLGQPELESSIVHLYNEDADTFEVFYAYRPPNRSSDEIITDVAHPPKYSSEWAREVINNYKSGRTEYTIVSSGEKIKEWYKVLEKFVSAVVEYDAQGHLVVPEILYYHFSKFSGGALLMISNQEPSIEARELQRRAAVVFDLAYTRFLDLKNAEAQAREAKIEASLERVRSKAMAMHSSEDLAAAIGIFYRELESFSITPRRCGVGLLEKETRMAELSTMNTTLQGESIEVVGTLKMQGHPVLEGVFDNWILQQEFHPVLRGNEIKEYYQLVRPQIAFPEYPNDAVQYGYFFFFPEGGVYAWTEKEMTEDEVKIYRRFTSVLSLTYKRYKDLKDAEGRARDAVKQAALDRVRADIASMRSTADLDRITPLIWKELTTLGIPFIRCGVFIMDEKENKVHSYLSTPDGRAIAAFHTPFENSGGLAGAIESWRLQNVYVAHWEDRDFQTQADILVSQGAIKTREQYLSTLPQGGFHLHFLPFVQGMLYVGSIVPLQQDDLLLVQSLAEAFSVAYARYEDFTRLEDAKKSIEVTLSDLRAAQSQLIQSEKMASLGELTAGIAHEIQNPLNFVNNFSEVSNELLEEMHEEIEKGNVDGAKSIAKDVRQNLEKILHHGKRADGIVKGMLQHSRTGSGQKEPTDINLLCDEYLRLAYHGLRAKDKSFNAHFETNFDETIGKIEVVPQDLGRVILNLINNAFYAVAEKSGDAKDSADKSYEPVVSVSTKNCESKILITVKDNGNGIPDSIKERIFQPFFTTKPTGQGTGLGLSLSYDIVKAHGGTIKVMSSDGKQTELAVEIPVKRL